MFVAGDRREREGEGAGAAAARSRALALICHVIATSPVPNLPGPRVGPSPGEHARTWGIWGAPTYIHFHLGEASDGGDAILKPINKQMNMSLSR